MKRLSQCLAATGLVLLVATPAQAADTVLKLSHNGPEQHPFQAGAEAFKQVLEAETNGAVEVQIFPGEQLGPEDQTSQMAKQGTPDSAGGGLAPFVPEADLFNMPFIFRDTDHFYGVVDGHIAPALRIPMEIPYASSIVGSALML